MRRKNLFKSKKKYRFVLIFFLQILSIISILDLALAGPIRSTQLNKNFFSGNVVKKTLANGVTVLVKPNPNNQVVSVNVFLKMGIEFEPKEQYGISDLMQRIVTSGTINRMDNIYYILETTNSWLYGNNGNITLRTTLIGFDSTFAYLLDVLKYASFPEYIFNQEKARMLVKLSSAGDQPSSQVYHSFYKLFYGDHPKGIPPNELTTTVTKLTRKHIEDWYSKIYIPNNIVISIVGDVDPVKVIAKVEETLASLIKTNLPEKTNTVLPERTKNQEVFIKKGANTLYMVLGYPAPDIQSEDSPVMEVINRLLGDEMSSRLFKKLRDKDSLAYSIRSNYYKTTELSCISVFMATAPKNYKEAKEKVINEFKRFSEELISESELSIAKRGLKGAYLVSHETNAKQSYYLGGLEINGVGYQYDDLYLELIDKVTAKDIQRVAKEYFNYYTLSVVSPVEVQK